MDEFRREGLPVHEIWRSEQLSEVVADMGYSDLDMLLAAAGEDHVSAVAVAQRVSKMFRGGGDQSQLPTTVFTQRSRRSDGESAPTIGVHVEGLDDVMIRMATCCSPVPGDEIVGFVTRGRGVNVHRSDCATAPSQAAEQAMRVIEVEWDGERTDKLFRTGVAVAALDRSQLLRDVANAVGDQGVNIVSCDTDVSDDRVARMRFQFEMSNPAQFGAVLATIKRIDGVFDVHRIVDGRSDAALGDC